MIARAKAKVVLKKEELSALKRNSTRYSTVQWDWALGNFSLTTIRNVVRKDEFSGGYSISGVPSTKLNSQCGVGYIVVQHALTQLTKRSSAESKATFRQLLDEQMLRHFCSNRKYVMATCNDQQEAEATELIKYGFEVIKDWTTNPNTGREIILLLYTFPSDSDLKEESPK